MELIKREDVCREIQRSFDLWLDGRSLMDRINGLPTVDAVPVVRCGECKHYNAGFECLAEGYGIERDPDWYCADGERKVRE